MNHRLILNGKDYYFHIENGKVTDACKELKKYIGQSVFTMVNIAAMKDGCSFEKIKQEF